jgi:hypothetical protein
VVVKRITQENGRGGSGAAVSFLLSQYLGEQKNDGQPNRPSAPKSQSLFSVLSGLKMGTSSTLQILTEQLHAVIEQHNHQLEPDI